MGSDPAWSHVAAFPEQLVSVSGTRAFVAHHLAEHEMGHLIDDVQMVVSELATNALLHARTPFQVRLVSLERAVLLLVEDGSPTGAVRADALDSASTGRGLTIVEALTREWGVTLDGDGGKAVWATFDLGGGA